MQSETLFTLEHAHVLSLALWSGASVVFAAGVLTYLFMRRVRAPLLRNFAAQMAGWGVAELVFAALWWHGLAERDYAGAMQLAALLRAAIVLELGCVAIGLTVALGGWLASRRLGALGAGLGVVVQGVALLVLDGMLLRRLITGG